MTRLLRLALLAVAILLGDALSSPGQSTAPPASVTSTPAPAVSPGPSSQELALLRALKANPDTAPYRIGTTLRNGQVVLWGRVGTKYVHDAAVRTAIRLGIPIRDELVIDTNEANRVALAPAAAVAAAAGFPGATLGVQPGYGSYVYPPPLFGRVDDPFFGLEPPLVTYPPWFGATAVREPIDFDALNHAGAFGPPVADPEPGLDPGMPVEDPARPAIPRGSVEMTIDPRGRAVLRGEVPTLADRVAVGQKVAQIPGVAEVLNLLTVGGATARSETPPPPPTPVPSPSPKAPSSPKPDPGDAVRLDREGGGDLSDRVSRALAERPALAGLPIKATARDGVVTLSGRVPSVYEAMLAFRAAQQTPGVNEIVDLLEFVVPDDEGKNPLLQKGRPEDIGPYLAAQINRQLGDLGHVDDVRPNGDTLVIGGTLHHDDDRPRLEAILRSMAVLRGFRLEPRFVAE